MADLTRDGVERLVATNDWSFAVFADEAPPRADAVVFEPREDCWAVYRTSERGSVGEPTFRSFCDEESALRYFVDRLQKHARYLRLLA